MTEKTSPTSETGFSNLGFDRSQQDESSRGGAAWSMSGTISFLDSNFWGFRHFCGRFASAELSKTPNIIGMLAEFLVREADQKLLHSAQKARNGANQGKNAAAGQWFDRKQTRYIHGNDSSHFVASRPRNCGRFVVCSGLLEEGSCWLHGECQIVQVWSIFVVI